MTRTLEQQLQEFWHTLEEPSPTQEFLERFNQGEIKMSKDYTAKYKLNEPKPDYPGKRGRKYTETTWEIDRRYAWMKHKAQARYRGEDYNLSLEDWETLWTHDAWHNRGRKPNNLTLYRVDATLPWDINNVVVIKQKDKGAYYQSDRNYGGRPRKQ